MVVWLCGWWLCGCVVGGCVVGGEKKMCSYGSYLDYL